jgi:hypothetical protein
VESITLTKKLMNVYIENRIRFLQTISCAKLLPEKDTLELKDDGKSILHLSMMDYVSGIREIIPSFIEMNIFFMIFDQYLELLGYNFEGKPFQEKYLLLPKNTNLEKVIASIYRIFKLCRNASVHNINKIKENKNNIEIDYNLNKANILLSITKDGIKYLKEFILCFLMYYESEYSYAYKELLFNSFFNIILNEIILFNDKNGKILKISNEEIDIQHRYECSTIKGILIDNTIRFDYPEKYKDESIDIIFEFNGEKYITPNEILREKNRINIFDIKKWKVIM